MTDKDYRNEILETIEKISNEEYLELIQRFAKSLINGGAA